MRKVMDDDTWYSIRSNSRVNAERRNSSIISAYNSGMSITDIAHAARISRRQVSRIILAAE